MIYRYGDLTFCRSPKLSKLQPGDFCFVFIKNWFRDIFAEKYIPIEKANNDNIE